MLNKDCVEKKELFTFPVVMASLEIQEDGGVKIFVRVPIRAVSVVICVEATLMLVGAGDVLLCARDDIVQSKAVDSVSFDIAGCCVSARTSIKVKVCVRSRQEGKRSADLRVSPSLSNCFWFTMWCCKCRMA